MAFLLPNNHCLLASTLLFVYVFSHASGQGYPFEYPHLGAAGVVANEYLPQAEPKGDQFLPHAGIIGTNAPLLFNKALQCFTEKSIYRSCDEAHRLSEDGNLHVPPAYTDEYCNGPCVVETNHVLDCIGGVFRSFLFLNKATLQNIRDTIEGGCGYGPARGNFNVLNHIQSDSAAKNLAPWPGIFAAVAMIAAWRLLF